MTNVAPAPCGALPAPLPCRVRSPVTGKVDKIRTGVSMTPAHTGSGSSAVVLAVSVAAAASALSWLPHWADQAATGAVNLLVVVSFAATAAVLRSEQEQRATARDIALAAVFYIASWGWAWPPQWHASPLPLFSFVGGYLWFVCLGAALTRYPHARLARPERWLLGTFAAWVCGVKLLLVATSRPPWAGFAERSWWLTVAPDRGVFTAMTTVFHYGLFALVLGMIVQLLFKIGRSRGLERGDTVPAVVAAGTIAVFGLLYVGTRVVGLAAEVQDVLRLATAVAALVTPVSFLVVVVRRQLARSAVADVLPRIYRVTSLDALRDVLRRTLHDPDLQLWHWRPDVAAHVAPDGTTAETTQGRYQVEIRSSDDLPLAMIGTRPSLRRHDRLVEAMGHAIGMVLERRSIAQEARLSIARLDGAELAARQRIARDLHDGAQQMLLTAALRLAVARRRADSTSVQVIDQANADVASAMAAIRDLAAGTTPAFPAGGLAAAVHVMVGDLEVPVTVDVTSERLPEQVERHVWFLVSEGLQNVRKHAAATAAEVVVARVPDGVVVRITDDGRGGADPTGSGLCSIAERVDALGGRLDVVSPAGHGTAVVIELPCA